jgi:hypothetical protein
MRSFLNNLFRSFRTTKTARPPRRATLQLEALENRLVPTTLSLFQTSSSSAALTLSISKIAAGDTIQLQCLSSNGNLMEVLDNGNVVNNQIFNKESINGVDIQGSANNQVVVTDSNGMPFAQGTAINLSGGISALFLEGSRTVTGNETYVAGGATSTPGTISLDNLTFTLNGVPNVVDEIAITGTLDVQTSGTNVVLSGVNGSTQTLSGMGFGGGGTLLYQDMPTVVLETYAVNAHVQLNATASETSENLFEVNMHGANDSTTIAATPSNVETGVQTDVAPVPNQASVTLQASAGPVYVVGTPSTSVFMGNELSNGEYSTKGIQADVLIDGAETLQVLNNGNVSTQENVTVTPSKIFSTGLFGNNNVVLTYAGVGSLVLFAGQLADQYTVEGDGFTSQIQITDEFSKSFRTDVFVDSGSDLKLSMFNDTIPQLAQLVIHPVDLTAVNKPDGQPAEGVVDLFSANELSSQVFYLGYNVSVE